PRDRGARGRRGSAGGGERIASQERRIEPERGSLVVGRASCRLPPAPELACRKREGLFLGHRRNLTSAARAAPRQAARTLARSPGAGTPACGLRRARRVPARAAG